MKGEKICAITEIAFHTGASIARTYINSSIRACRCSWGMCRGYTGLEIITGKNRDTKGERVNLH